MGGFQGQPGIVKLPHPLTPKMQRWKRTLTCPLWPALGHGHRAREGGLPKEEAFSWTSEKGVVIERECSLVLPRAPPTFLLSLSPKSLVFSETPATAVQPVVTQTRSQEEAVP